MNTLEKPDNITKMTDMAERISVIRDYIYETNYEINKLWAKLSSQLISSKNYIGSASLPVGSDLKYDIKYELHFYLYDNGIGYTYNNKRNSYKDIDNLRITTRPDLLPEGSVMPHLSSVLNDELVDNCIKILDETRNNDKSTIIKEFWKFVKNGVPESTWITDVEYIFIDKAANIGKLDKETLDYMEKSLQYAEKIMKHHKENYMKLQEGLKSYIIQDEMKEMKI